LVTPELALTGATCGDLFLSQALLNQTETAIDLLRNRLPKGVLLVCGAPRSFDGVLYDGAVLIERNHVLGFVPKTQFRQGDTRMRCFSTQPLNMPATFEFEDMNVAVTFGLTASPNADLVLCLDAEAEGCGKDERRRTALRYLSATAGNAWVYANAGDGESSTDGLYSGHRLCAWEGRLLAEAQWTTGLSLMDFSPAWIRAHRQRMATTPPAPTEARFPLMCDLPHADGRLAGLRKNPFIPEDAAERAARCRSILQMQVQALWRRFRQIRAKRLVLGLSGGLDSTLALIVCTQLCRQHQLPDDTVLAVTMPGFGTSDRTYNNACALAKTLGADLREISIVPTVEQHFKDIGHDPADHSVTYENAQARARTYLLMDIAN
jgi:NAD+ synthase (glutamine-hydrolysing)